MKLEKLQKVENIFKVTRYFLKVYFLYDGVLTPSRSIAISASTGVSRSDAAEISVSQDVIFVSRCFVTP